MAKKRDKVHQNGGTGNFGSDLVQQEISNTCQQEKTSNSSRIKTETRFYTRIKFEQKEKYAVITLARPKLRNAIDMKMMEELNHAIQLVKKEKKLRAVVLTGQGNVFCAGGDLKEMKNSSNKYEFLRELSKSINRNTLEFRNLEIPVIGLVDGMAYGAGFCLTEVCDFVICSQRTTFNAGYINVGLAPGCGSYHLPRLIGLRKTMELLLLGETFDSQEARRLGLVNYVVPKEKLWEQAEKLIHRISTRPRESLNITKSEIYKTLETGFHSQIENESQAIAEAGLTKDFIEGLNAFFEKRKPEFGKDQ